MNNENRRLSEEAASVVQEMIQFREKGRAGEGLSNRTFLSKSASVSVWIIGFGLILIANFVSPDHVLLQPENRRFFLIGLLLVVLLAVVLLYYEYSSSGLLRFFNDPVGNILHRSAKNVEAEALLFERLDLYSVKTVAHVRDSFASSSRTAASVSGLLVGVLKQAGILPALLATVVALTKISDSAGFSVHEYLAFGLIGFYFLGFQIAVVSIKYDQYKDLLRTYLATKSR